MLLFTDNTRDRDRTCDLEFRKPTLYPTELRGRDHNTISGGRASGKEFVRDAAMVSAMTMALRGIARPAPLQPHRDDRIVVKGAGGRLPESANRLVVMASDTLAPLAELSIPGFSRCV